ncbi:hypothetical protein EWM64_g10161 [Hericium alpestre]|uniref:Uncharacterized protein n=1 Tax=Hericium alpestre TaxID=135208 RepID=A0A4Y9ZJ21_9AGAM|nr:hypothetical protein EWM64_g10161 [Hericium alpestre]
MTDILRDIYEPNVRKVGAYKTSYQASRKVAVALKLDLTGEEHTDRPIVARALHKYLAQNKSRIHHNVLRWPPGSTDGPGTSVFVSQVVFLKDDPNLANKELVERDEDRAAKAWLIKHGMEKDELEWVSFWDNFGFAPFGIEEHRPVVKYTYSEPAEPRDKEEWEKQSDREVDREIERILKDERIMKMLKQGK